MTTHINRNINDNGANDSENGEEGDNHSRKGPIH